MKKFINSASAFVLLTAISSPVFAGDIYSKGSTKDAGMEIFQPTEGTVNWSGFYVGVQGGYGNANHNLTVQQYREDFLTECKDKKGCKDFEGNAVADGEKYVANKTDAGLTTDLLNLDGLNSSGGIGGGRIGYDYARGRLLFGLFAEYNFSNIETTLSIPVAGNATFGLEKDDEWSVGGRLGYVVAPRTLAYVLAAYTQTEYNVVGLGGVVVPPPGSLKTGASFDGITVGGGMEFALASNIFLGVEYQHTFYGEETILDMNSGGNGASGFRVLDDLDEDKVMATLKLKLNGFGQ